MRSIVWMNQLWHHEHVFARFNLHVINDQLNRKFVMRVKQKKEIKLLLFTRNMGEERVEARLQNLSRLLRLWPCRAFVRVQCEHVLLGCIYFWISFGNVRIGVATVRYVEFVCAATNWPSLWQVCRIDIETIYSVVHLSKPMWWRTCVWWQLLSAIAAVGRRQSKTKPETKQT